MASDVSGKHSTGGVRIVLPTFRRDDALAKTLRRLGEQSRAPVQVLVIDNAARPDCRRLCEKLAADLPFIVTYLATDENVGPAGATALGMRHLVPSMCADDWIGRCDDDSPEISSDHFGRLARFIETIPNLKTVGAVGTHGACWDPRRATLSEKTSSWTGVSEVDYLATGWFPLYRVGAIQQVGVFRDDLFFGLTEPEYGLRLRRAGFAVLRLDTGPRPRPQVSRRANAPTWRQFYSNRNRIVLAREYGAPFAATRVVAALVVKPLLNMPRQPSLALRSLAWNLRAVYAAMTGRMGRTVEPRLVSDQLDSRRASRSAG